MKKHALFVVLIIGVALIIGIWRDNQGATHNAEQFSTSHFPQAQKVPQFELMDMHGNRFTNAQLQQHWTFLFFGYTACPDICPAMLNTIQKVSQQIGGQFNTQFVFISIDPTHDTPQNLKEYLQQEKYHHTPIIGVTGASNKLHQLAQELGVHIEHGEEIEHGGTLLLINPEGKMTALFTHNKSDPLTIVQDFKQILHHYARNA